MGSDIDGLGLSKLKLNNDYMSNENLSYKEDLWGKGHEISRLKRELEIQKDINNIMRDKFFGGGPGFGEGGSGGILKTARQSTGGKLLDENGCGYAESRIYDREAIKNLLEKDGTSDGQRDFDMVSGPNGENFVYNDLLEKCRSAVEFDEINGELYKKLADTIADYKDSRARTEMRSYENLPEPLAKRKNVNFGKNLDSMPNLTRFSQTVETLGGFNENKKEIDTIRQDIKIIENEIKSKKQKKSTLTGQVDLKAEFKTVKPAQTKNIFKESAKNHPTVPSNFATLNTGPNLPDDPQENLYS